MRLIAWNMGRRRENAAWDYLLNKLRPRPRVALLQETDPPSMAREAGELCHAQAYSEHGWGSAVFVREGRLRELPLPEEHRGWLMAAEVELDDWAPFVAVSVHARMPGGYVRPNLDRAFEVLDPLVADRSFVVGGDFNLSRLYDEAYGTTHHGQFFDLLEGRGFFNCHRKFHEREEQTFWGTNTKTAYQNDHIYVSADLADRVTACDVVPRAGFEHLSDHSALALELAEA